MASTNSSERTQTNAMVWRPEDLPKEFKAHSNYPLYRPDILNTIGISVDALDTQLRKLSQDIHDHPELRFEEHLAHDLLTSFMTEQGFEVTKHYHLPTAWLATYSRGTGGRNIGINSEMDALPGIGHACGHNLIAIAGVSVACALKAAMEKWDISGKITLLGTPAEEGGSGKVILLDKGAYKDMDICLMCHPAPGPQHSVSLSSCLALQRIEVEYFGHTAHAALSPWEGQNALDAAVLAYNSIAVLRQQIKPTHRIHGIIQGKDWVPNVIPDYAKMIWYIRAPTRAELEVVVDRVKPCFTAAALATGCEAKTTILGATYDLRQNYALGSEVANVVQNLYGYIDYKWGIHSASTDFGNVTYALPSLHPGFAIPTVVDGGNHTPAFTKSAGTLEAHKECLLLSKALAAAGVRVLTDDQFFTEVQKSFEANQTQAKLA